MTFAIPAMTPLEWWAVAAFLELAVVQTIFIFWWGTTRWWVGYVGKSFYFKSSALAVMADTVTAGVFFDWPYEDLTKTVIYWIVAIGATAQLVAFGVKRKEIRQEAAEASYGKVHVR